MRKSTVAALVLLAVCASFLLALYLCPVFAQYCAQNISRPIDFLTSRLSQHIRVPLAELLLIAGGVLLVERCCVYIRSCIRAKCTRRMLDGLSVLSLVLACLLTFYCAAWAPMPLTPQLRALLPEEDYTTAELSAHCYTLLKQANALRDTVGNALLYDTDALMHNARDAVAAVELLSLRPTLPKAMRYSELLRMMGAAGVYVPWTGEALISLYEPEFSLPFAVCHELAHQCGIGREDEANLIAYLACLKGDGFFRYSGTLYALRYGMDALRERDFSSWVALRSDMTDALRRDFDALPDCSTTSAFSIQDGVSDAFLRLSRQSGIQSYAQMTGLLIAYGRLGD